MAEHGVEGVLSKHENIALFANAAISIPSRTSAVRIETSSPAMGAVRVDFYQSMRCSDPPGDVRVFGVTGEPAGSSLMAVCDRM
jgi:hypothetical protein